MELGDVSCLTLFRFAFACDWFLVLATNCIARSNHLCFCVRLHVLRLPSIGKARPLCVHNWQDETFGVEVANEEQLDRQTGRQAHRQILR